MTGTPIAPCAAAPDPALALPDDSARALADATLADPFAVLGPHGAGADWIVRAFLPGAEAVTAVAAADGAVLAPLTPVQIPGLFAARIPRERRYLLRICWPDGEQLTEDPYGFGLLLGELDLYLFGAGRHYELGHCLGAQAMRCEGVEGVRFAVWAPNARRVAVVGDFNSWDGRRHPLRRRVEAGLWELFVPRIGAGQRYKFEVLGADGARVLKADPVALQAEAPPQTASVVAASTPFPWTDADWRAGLADRQSVHAPLAVYEVHAGSWRRAATAGNRALDWDELAAELVPYVVDLGFTHIELMPIAAHPFGGSWGYQPLGLFAPHAGFGTPAAFQRFVDRCHGAGIGVLLDWVPAHFPADPHGLVRFDGTALYEHADPREGFHQDWNTLIYNLGRREVHNFVLASALHWLEHYHLDGLRVDAVASMLYRDYSRRPGEWVPNVYGGRENLEAVEFLRHFTSVVQQRCPGALVIAEESTAWPGVTHALGEGGLGFSYKWNMGWMHDSLQYLGTDPLYRSYHHDQLTFGLVYAFSERFVLPLSHDEVVHGKGSLLARMPGDRWQQFANLRAYFGFLWTHPGKKLLFMGGEFGQPREWNHDAELDWPVLQDPLHAGVQRLVRDLNRLYVELPALHAADCDAAGFRWIIGDDRRNSVFAFYRAGYGDTRPLIAVCNFTPLPHHGYRIGAPRAGFWREVLNSDSAHYGGSDLGNGGGVRASAEPSHGQPFSLALTLPPLATVLLLSEG